jgi:hypothetical protein
MARRTAAILGSVCLALIVLVGSPSAGAETCYPPPCAGAVAGPQADMNASVVATPAPTDHRSPAPYVAAGLLLVTATLTTLCVTRRSEMATRSASRPEPLAGSHPPLRKTERFVA